MYQKIIDEIRGNTIVGNIFDDGKIIGKIIVDDDIALNEIYLLVVDGFIKCYEDNNFNVPANLMIFMRNDFYVYEKFDYLDHHIKTKYPQYYNEMKKYEVLP
jgi:hypothetical protein